MEEEASLIFATFYYHRCHTGTKVLEVPNRLRKLPLFSDLFEAVS